MARGALIALLLLAAPAHAQTAAPSDSAKAMVGSWEFSNADRDKRCTITFRTDAGPSGMKLEFDKGCPAVFAFTRQIAGWTLAQNDFLRLVDSKGDALLEFSEVESGMYEAPRPGEGILFIQKAAAVGPAPRDAADMLGDWSVARTAGRTICTLALSETAAGDDFALQVKPPCDAFVTRFAPTTWQMDRGELVLKSARGQVWRFAEGDDKSWRRVPEGADAVTLTKK